MKILFRVAAPAVLVVLSAYCASGDTLLLANGGQVEGTIEQVVLLQGGVEKAFAGGTFVGVTLGAKGEDAVQMTPGKEAAGELLTVQIRSVAGVLTFKRADIRTVVVAPTKDAEIRKQYDAKRAAVKDDDARGLCELAVWCRDNGLVIEAHRMAELCLKANPAPELEVVAHRVLGHVLVDGQWVEAPAAVSTPAAPAAPADSGTPTQPANPPVEGSKVVDAASAELYRKLAAEYMQKVADAKTKDQEAVKTQYKAQWDKLGETVKKAEGDVTQTENRRDQLRDDIAAERRTVYSAGTGWDAGNRLSDLQHEYDRVTDKLAQVRATLEKDRRDQLTLAVKVKTAKSDASTHAAQRDDRLAIAKSKIERLLVLGRKFTEAEMRAVFDEAVK